MGNLSWIHQGLFFAHLVAFAIAVSAVLREDMRLLGGGGIDPSLLARTARTVSRSLAALWATGLAMIACECLRAVMVVVFIVRPRLCRAPIRLGKDATRP